MEDRDKILTPETDPEHPTIGRYFEGFSINLGRQAVFYCAKWDWTGFWMHPMDSCDDSEPRSVSERTIGTNFKRVYGYESREGNRLFCGCVVFSDGPAPGCEQCVESPSYKFVAQPVDPILGIKLAEKVREIHATPEKVKVTNKERQVLTALAEGDYLCSVNYSSMMAVISPNRLAAIGQIDRNEFDRLPHLILSIFDRLKERGWIKLEVMPLTGLRGYAITNKGRAAIGLPQLPESNEPEAPTPAPAPKPEESPEDVARAALDKYLEGVVNNVIQTTNYVRDSLEEYPEDVDSVLRASLERAVRHVYRRNEVAEIVRRLKLKSTVESMIESLDGIDQERSEDFVARYKPLANPGLTGAIEEMRRFSERVVILYDLPRLRERLTGEKPSANLFSTEPQSNMGETR